MPTFVLATIDSELAASWECQLPSGRTALRLEDDSFPATAAPGFSAVVVLDSASELSLPPAFAKCPTIFVGEPRSHPFEQARMAGRAKVYLSYDESKTRLRELLPLLEEIAEKQSMLDFIAEKNRRTEIVRPAAKTVANDPVELWDFLEGAVENLDTRDRLIAEFRRASRHLLRASHAVFFHREADGFRADRGTSFFPSDDPLVAFFENHPAVLDGTNWDTPADPSSELAVRNRLGLWGARLLVPVHDNGRLLGLIALGVRDDGQPYDELDRARAVFFARLMRHFLAKSAQFSRMNMIAEKASLGNRYLPSTLVLASDESAPRHVPLVIRDLIGQARRKREVCRVAPSSGQPFRASAGTIVETGGVWAYWEEASNELHEAATRQRAGRRSLLRELSLTVNHELGNALVSLTTFRQATLDRPLPAAMLETVRSDITKLETLNDDFSLMQTLHEGHAAPVDIRELAQSVGKGLVLRVEVGPEPVQLLASKKLLEFALRSLIQTLGENRGEMGTGELVLTVRSTGAGSDLTALLSLKGKHLELEGILPEPTDDATPNLGRISIFLAKEILRLHHGEIHAGPGIEGTEILFSLRHL